MFFYFDTERYDFPVNIPYWYPFSLYILCKSATIYLYLPIWKTKTRKAHFAIKKATRHKNTFFTPAQIPLHYSTLWSSGLCYKTADYIVKYGLIHLNYFLFYLWVRSRKDFTRERLRLRIFKYQAQDFISIHGFYSNLIKYKAKLLLWISWVTVGWLNRNKHTQPPAE